jgi:transcriptional regulator GlxA family with amidase domain
MPPELRAAIRHLFRAPREIRSTVDLASAGRLNLRTLDRWIGRAGLASPGAVISCARLVRACWLLRMARCRLSDASDRAGFPSIRSLRHRLVATTGLSPSLLRAADSTASILDRFEASVRSA